MHLQKAPNNPQGRPRILTAVSDETPAERSKNREQAHAEAVLINAFRALVPGGVHARKTEP